MTLDEASNASGVTIAMVAPTACNPTQAAHVVGDPFSDPVRGTHLGFGVLNGRIVRIWTSNPAFLMPAGLHVGSTEAEVLKAEQGAHVETTIYGSPVLRLTGAQGHVMLFFEGSSTDRVVGQIEVAQSSGVIDVGRC
jgi:hypothetical protein